jgi:flagellar FliL protein
MNKKILIPVVIALLGGGYEGYSMATAKPAPKQRIDGAIYVLPKEFLVNLADGRFGKFTVALVLAPGQSAGATGEGAATPPEGFGTLPEEAAIRDIITNVVTDQTGKAMISPIGRDRIKQKILLGIRSGTDVKVSNVLFTDVAVQ